MTQAAKTPLYLKYALKDAERSVEPFYKISTKAGSILGVPTVHLEVRDEAIVAKNETVSFQVEFQFVHVDGDGSCTPVEVADVDVEKVVEVMSREGVISETPLCVLIDDTSSFTVAKKAPLSTRTSSPAYGQEIEQPRKTYY